MCRLWLEALGQAKPGQKKPGQAGPKIWLVTAFGPAQGLVKPKPTAQAPAFVEYKAEFEIYTEMYSTTKYIVK
jgi:hypothetical protein